MKNLLLCLLLLVPNLAITQEAYRFEFKDQKLIHNSEDWYYLIEEESYNFYLAIDISKTEDGLIRIHSLAQFKNPQDQVIEGSPISKLYTFGVLSCKHKLFHVLNDFYVNENDQIIHTENYSSDEFVVELNTQHDLRRKVYEFACNRGLST